MSGAQDQYFDRALKSAGTFLARWKSSDALMRELTVSIRRLRLLLTRPGVEGNLLIACLDPIRLRGPISWKDANLTISRARLSIDGRGDGFLLVDVEADVEILCGAIELKENVKL